MLNSFLRHATPSNVLQVVAFVSLFSVWGCGDDSAVVDADVPTSDATVADANVDGAEPLVPQASEVMVVPPTPLAAAEERADLCFSHTLSTTEVAWLSNVSLTTSPVVHHSNWFWVPLNTYDGPDGLWPCRERGFNTINAGAAGSVIFAQSTQATVESQRFPDGAALKVPAGVRVVGQLHFLNLTGDAQEAEMEMTLDFTTLDKVTTRLQGMAFDYNQLALPPRMLSEFAMDCDFAGPSGGPIGFKIYHILPHYHGLGDFLKLSLIGGDRDGETLWQTRRSAGEALGETFDDPLDLGSATGIRMTCGFENPTEQTVGYGIGDQEMCLLLAFTDARTKFAGGTVETLDGAEVSRDENTSYNEASCAMFAIP